MDYGSWTRNALPRRSSYAAVVETFSRSGRIISADGSVVLDDSGLQILGDGVNLISFRSVLDGTIDGLMVRSLSNDEILIQSKGAFDLDLDSAGVLLLKAVSEIRVNIDVLPATGGTIDLGNSGRRFIEVWGNTVRTNEIDAVTGGQQVTINETLVREEMEIVRDLGEGPPSHAGSLKFSSPAGGTYFEIGTFGQGLDYRISGTSHMAMTAEGWIPLVTDLDLGASTGITWRDLFLDEKLGMIEMTAPSAPSANRASFFCRDNGSGKTQLAVIFSTGAIQVIATEP